MNYVTFCCRPAESSEHALTVDYEIHRRYHAGYGPTAGAAMTDSPLVDKISFTGSTGLFAPRVLGPISIDVA